MTQRERNMMIVLVGLLGFALIGGLFFFLVILPLGEVSRQEEQLRDAIHKKDMTLVGLHKDRKLLKTAAERSLQLNPHQAAIDYQRYLDSTLKNAGLVVDFMEGPSSHNAKVTGAAALKGGKKTTQTALPFKVRATGSLDQLVKALKTMQETPVLHRIKKLALNTQDPTTKDKKGRNKNEVTLRVHMEVEALMFHGAKLDHKPSYTATSRLDPPGTNPDRAYGGLASRNIFTGFVWPEIVVKKDEAPVEDPVETVDVRMYHRLEHIGMEAGASAAEAFVRNHLEPAGRIRLRPRTGFNDFVVKSESGREILKGKVLKIDQRDVYFSVGDSIYGWHIGYTLHEATRRSLSDEQLEELGLLKGKSKTGKK